MQVLRDLQRTSGDVRSGEEENGKTLDGFAPEANYQGDEKGQEPRVQRTTTCSEKKQPRVHIFLLLIGQNPRSRALFVGVDFPLRYRRLHGFGLGELGQPDRRPLEHPLQPFRLEAGALRGLQGEAKNRCT